MILHLGVDPEETPYADEGSKTVGDVAEIIEDKFHVMQIFADMHEQDMADELSISYANAMDSIFSGRPMPKDFAASATAKIGDMFETYINTQEHGIDLKKLRKPLAGSRKKRQYRKAKAATAFLDTGLYRGAFKAWTE